MDRDVFQPYTGQNRKSSINADEIPTYKPELKTSSSICGLISSADKEQLLSSLKLGRYEQALDILDAYSIISMRYTIEIDLIACSSFCNSYCEVLGVSAENRNARFLAMERSDSIKKLDTVCEVINRNSTKNLPASYKRIVKKTREMIS